MYIIKHLTKNEIHINMILFFQLEIDKLKLQAEDIVTENQQLQEKFERIQTENPVDMNDW